MRSETTLTQITHGCEPQTTVDKWDMDGIIVDTESYFIDSARAIVEREWGLGNPGLAHELVGSNLWDMADRLRPAGQEVADSPEQTGMYAKRI